MHPPRTYRAPDARPTRARTQAGAIIMSAMVALSIFSILLLVECKGRLRAVGAVSFADVGQGVYGAPMKIIINMLLVFTQFGFATVYMGLCRARRG